jgi:hypothetical protein
MGLLYEVTYARHPIFDFDIALNTVYNWKLNPKSKPRQPAGYWNDKVIQRLFFDKLAIKLNVRKPEDWYSVGVKTVLENGGHFVNKIYNGSLIQGTEVTVNL